MRAILFALLCSPLFADDLLQDFDHDGHLEKVAASELGNPIYENTTGQWKLADFALPEGLRWRDEMGHDTGLRFVDLNQDGFDDILYANETELAIYLWTKEVKPRLGWTKGWSQPVRSGVKRGAWATFPNLKGAKLQVSDGTLSVQLPAPSGDAKETSTWNLRELIAFEVSDAKSPSDALKTFSTLEGFEVELVANEPQVIDPIAMEWDQQGQLWVVEMRDYPLGMDGKGKAGGVVKRLMDEDGDGHYEKAEVFMEGLRFPTGVFPWRKGVLISAAPDVIYAEDTDGDGRADKTEVLLTGFHPGNEQHLVNGFEWGLDGWLYVANGDSGGTVKSLKTGKELSIRGRDLRFKPDTGEMETVSSQSQFGRRRDDWNHWFGNNNSHWLWHVTFPEHYLRRNPKLAISAVRKNTSQSPDATRVFPTSAALERPNQPWALNHVTSACSPTLYRDDLMGEEFANSVFVSEPVHNLVHREVLTREGNTFTSRRAANETDREFLASSDPWFRPTGLKVGPDGALYVADMYRLVVEHPEWISPEMQARMNLRAGEDKGRIYRIAPSSKKRREIPDLTQFSGANLAKQMNSSSGWQRDQVMRLLVETSQIEAIPELRALTSLTQAPQVRLQALATLGLLKGLSEDLLIQAYADPHPAVKAEALRQTDAFPHQSERLFEAMVALAKDADLQVKTQLAFSLGEWPSAQKLPWLQRLAQGADETLRLAIMSSLSPDDDLFKTLSDPKNSPTAPALDLKLKASSQDRAAVIARYEALTKFKGDAKRGETLFQNLCSICHQLRGAGHELGPDLGMVSTKPTEWLLTAILDPNQVVESRYQTWSVVTHAGTTLTGVLMAETTNNIVLKLPGGISQPVLRQDIRSLTPIATSLMPAGFESALPPQSMADLIEWLQSK